jgi:glycosyltransferase involved in cell wall biosynthesis
MKALILDPALRSMGGHHHNALLTLQRELSERRISVRTLGSAFADQSVTDVLGVVPTFTRSVYWRKDWSDAGFADAVRQTNLELRRAQRWQFAFAPVDLIVAPCCDQVLAFALANYLGRRPGRRVPRVLLWLLYAPDYNKAIDDPLNLPLFKEYERAFKALLTSIEDRTKLTVCCETAAMAKAYGPLLDVEIAVEPGPNLLSGTSRLHEKQQEGNDLITVVCVGFANQSKGYRLLPEAIDRILQTRNDVRFLVHGTVAGSDSEHDATLFRRLAQMGPRVLVNTSVLPQDQYLNWLKQGQIVLLPYDPQVYKTRGSGVFVEAKALGIPVVVTRGCNFASRAVEEGWAQDIIDYSPDGVADALGRALSRLPVMKARAEIAANDMQSQILLGSTLRSVLDAVVAAERPGSNAWDSRNAPASP